MTIRQPVMNPRQRQAEQIYGEYENRGTRLDFVGDKLRKKGKTSTRIILNNPNGLTGLHREEKITRIRDKCLKHNVDILCLVEEGQNLRHIKEEEKLRNTMKGWWESSTSHQAYNRHFDTG